MKLIFSATCLVSMLAASIVQSQEAVELRHLWEFDPDLGCWRLDAPEPAPLTVDMDRLSSEQDVYRIAEVRRIVKSASPVQPEQRDAVVGVVQQALLAGEANAQLRLALVSASLKLASDEQLHELWKMAASDEILRSVVEAGLIERRHPAAKSQWLSRLSLPDVRERDLRLAIRGVSAISATEAIENLRELVRSDALTLPIKLVASQSLGHLSTDGQETLARELLDSQAFAKEQLAASILVQHEGEAAARMMRDIFDSEFAPAQIMAFRWLDEHASEIAHELSQQALGHQDHQMRLLALKHLHQWHDAESLNLQGGLLSDRNPTVRRSVRDHLIEKAGDPTLEPIVNEILNEQLKGEQFQGSEQAVLVVAALDQKERSGQLIALLAHPRPEVSIRAAWALQQIVDAEPALDAIFEYCQEWTAMLESEDRAGLVSHDDVIRLAFLFQALGRNRYQPADGMLRKYVPKNDQRMRSDARAAAIWALGEIYRGQEEADLIHTFAARMLDNHPLYPEDPAVRYSSAIAIGKIGGEQALKVLSPISGELPPQVVCAVEWGISQLQ